MTLYPSAFLRFLGLPLICFAALSLAGGHWIVLQSIAWTQMMVEYSENGTPFTEAAIKTFSGEFPCSMCLKIEEGRQHEQSQPTIVQNIKKHEVFYDDFLYILPRPFVKSHTYFGFTAGYCPSRNDAPPAPVPILV
ncbi:MAG: hypothetical protein ACK5NG_02650 [Chthoniobacterales bacterium]